MNRGDCSLAAGESSALSLFSVLNRCKSNCFSYPGDSHLKGQTNPLRIGWVNGERLSYTVKCTVEKWHFVTDGSFTGDHQVNIALCLHHHDGFIPPGTRTSKHCLMKGLEISQLNFLKCQILIRASSGCSGASQKSLIFILLKRAQKQP